MTKILTMAVALLLSSGLALAQTPAPAPTQPAPTATPPAAAGSDAMKKTAPEGKKETKKGPLPKDQRTPESLACSAEADQKNLHGKERKAFRAKCMAAAKKAAKGTAGPTSAPGAAPGAGATPAAQPPAAKK